MPTEPAIVTHAFWKVAHVDRVKVTASVVQERGRTIVFTRTKRGADRVARQLGALGIAAVALHGDRSQAQRDRALAAFHDGRAAALVATDVAARGIHVDQVGCVVHFDPPADHKDYVHRSGRTGRAGATGFVVTLVIPERQTDVAAIGRALGIDVDFERVDASHIERAKPAQPAKVARDRDRERAASHQARRDRAEATGVVKFFDARKGYGFITLGTASDPGTDVFVHSSAVQASGFRTLEPGLTVSFDLENGRKGQEAHRIRALR